MKATTTGFVYGQATGGGTGPFLFDGMQTFLSLPWPDFVFLDLSDTGLILAHEMSDSPFLTDLHGIHQTFGPQFDGKYEYLISPSGSALAITRAGDAILVKGVNQFDPVAMVPGETGLTVIFASRTFRASAIPEPLAGGLFALGLAALAVRGRRPGLAP